MRMRIKPFHIARTCNDVLIIYKISNHGWRAIAPIKTVILMGKYGDFTPNANKLLEKYNLTWLDIYSTDNNEDFYTRLYLDHSSEMKDFILPSKAVEYCEIFFHRSIIEVKKDLFKK